MAQKRMLNKSISLSSQVSKLSLKEKLLFTWSIPHLDDYGLIENDPEVIKATVCPMVKEIIIQDIKQFVNKAEVIGLVIVYQDCIEFTGFENHQSISAEKRAKCKFQKIPKIPQENSGENKIPQEILKKSGIREDKIREDKINSVKGTAVAVPKLKPINDITFVYSIFKQHYGVSPKPIRGKNGKYDLNAAAAVRLVKVHTREKLKKMLEFVLSYQNTDRYCRISTCPLDFEKNYTWYKTYFEQKKNIKMSRGILR